MAIGLGLGINAGVSPDKYLYIPAQYIPSTCPQHERAGGGQGELEGEETFFPACAPLEDATSDRYPVMLPIPSATHAKFFRRGKLK